MSDLNERTELLHAIAARLAEMSITESLDVALQTLEFLKDIEDKTADDLRRIRDQEKLVDTLSGEEYRVRVSNLITENFNILSDNHLRKYFDELEYTAALDGVNMQLVPAMEEVSQELLLGVVTKPTLQ